MDRDLILSGSKPEKNRKEKHAQKKDRASVYFLFVSIFGDIISTHFVCPG
ncbi:Uncharacterized protein dnm_037360 [Desulfonema magnum]|uniref:Uncharacterized protein n=1 Tax=Desulfonema magnum TaxID=45655 RepID=A0A975GNF3_9BACT|nr:Uncharacterized protein dnm_037360 [Desulfonema magnum]